MKKSDLLFVAVMIAIFLPFFLSQELYGLFQHYTKMHPYVMSFLKFSILATLGELLGLRLKFGHYNEPGFGAFPRAITWGFLGIFISMGMTIFSSGAPVILTILGIADPDSSYGELLGQSIFESKSCYHVLAAFTISLFMNVIFAPIFMILHKVSDTHIVNNGGTMRGYLKKMMFGDIFVSLDWKIIWNFLFKRTIPLFWIPAHTITFMLPVEFRVLFAALLGIMLGVFMSLATRKKA